MNEEIIRKVCSEIIEQTKEKYISFKVCKEKSSIFSSKLGGIPYIPDDFNCPEIKNKNLRFLGQINFEEEPYLDEFPRKGILQFFISPNEDILWGAADYKKYKVIYHEYIDYSVKEKEITNYHSYNFPIKGECSLKGKIAYSSITVNDSRFNKVFMRCYKKYVSTKAESYWEIEGINEDKINKIFSSKDIRCGGNPAFIQDDIRQYNKEFGDSILLFEIPSILNEDINISWGDSGIANFFINRRELKKRDFKNVLFSWECY